MSFIIIDNTHLTQLGVRNMLRKSRVLYIVTTNKNHPALKIKDDGLIILLYPNKIDFSNLFTRLKREFGAKRVTIQSGGTLNSILIRQGLIDRVSLVVAPALIGGKDTSTLVDGRSLCLENELKEIKVLKLIKCNKLKNSYLHLVYSVSK